MISEKRTKDLIEIVEKTKVLGLLPYAYTLSWCNNNCEFCCLKPIRNNKLMSFEQFKQIGNCEIDWLRNNIDKLPKDTLLKHYFIGGEIGVLPNEYFNYFYELFDSLYSITSSKQVNLDIVLFSNLILIKKQINRLFNLFDYVAQKTERVSIVTSFDLTGRFSNSFSLKLWKKNVETILNRKHNLLIEVVLTKSAVNKYINEKSNDIVVLFDKLLEMDANKKITVAFNEYQPYDSKSMSEIPTFYELCNFYKEMYNRHNDGLNIFLSHDINEKIDEKDFKTYCELADLIPMFDKEASPCELIPYIFWPENDPINKKDIIKNKLNGEFNCLKQPEKIEKFFNDTYNCSICKYQPWCSKRHLRGCYQDHQFIWKDSNCIHKKIFEIVNE